MTNRSTRKPATKSRKILLVLLVAFVLANGCKHSKPLRVSFSQSAPRVEAYDFIEITVNVSWPRAQNPFTDSALTGHFQSADGGQRWQVKGFCDSEDGSVFKIRFMPPAAGKYTFDVHYSQAGTAEAFSGVFSATDGHRRGPVRVDSNFPWHFIWEGTGEHYFFNGTTAYWLLGWNDEQVIRQSIERLHDLKINRIRVTVAGRTNVFYGEPVMVDKNWTVYILPWPAKEPEDIFQPGFDYTRFNVAYWQKFERAVRFARDRDMIISLVLDMKDSHSHPAPGSADEQRFIQYAIARFGSFSNITWDLGDDLDLFRTNSWTHDTGRMIERLDPYHHLATSHPVNDINQDRGSDWFGFTSFQDWSRGQHALMLKERERQKWFGRIIPQTNEEYGYEDHYPLWSEGLGSESADTLRRTAWDIAMAGAYQTTGESARRGTNVWPDTGGGWMNGRGDNTMTMLQGYAHMVDFFTSFEWWKTDPHDDIVNPGNYCLALPGKIYALYMPHGGQVTVKLQPGSYSAQWFDPATGKTTNLPEANGVSWTSPRSPDEKDWAILLIKK